jgi:hypothetical protein
MRLVSLVPAAAALLLAACTPGAPPGFSGGTSWSFPLVTPLEGGPLLVAVTIHGHGPYLFQIDPDAPVSELDAALQTELDLRGATGPEFVDEADKGRNTMTAEVNHIKLGTLSVDAPMTWLVTPIGTFNSGGHQVRGVLGRDVFADSMVWGFDRQQGMGWLATQKGFVKPPDATVITTRVEKVRTSLGLRAVGRRLTHAIINGQQRTVHVDLGAVDSQLRASLWDKTGLTAVAVKRVEVDEAGTARQVTQAGIASKVEIGGITAENVLFVPYEDRRWMDNQLDGTVGLDVFDGHQVWANQNTNTYYLTGEQPTDAQARIDRWGSTALTGCGEPACTTISLLVPQAPGEPGAEADAQMGRPVLAVSRTAEVASIALEVLVEARSADGGATDLPRFVVVFPAGETQVSIAVEPEYMGTTFAVVDVSPFPRACPHEGACVYQLAEGQ